MNLMEYHQPGFSIYCSAKMNVDWPMAGVDQVTKKTSQGFFAYKVYLNSHFKSLFEKIDFYNDASNDCMVTNGWLSPRRRDQSDRNTLKIQELSKILATLKADNDKMSIELENTTKLLLTTSSHNQELYRHVSNMALRDEAQRKDGASRNVIFKDKEDIHQPGPSKEDHDLAMHAPSNIATLHRTVTG